MLLGVQGSYLVFCRELVVNISAFPTCLMNLFREFITNSGGSKSVSLLPLEPANFLNYMLTFSLLSRTDNSQFFWEAHRVCEDK